MADRTTSSIVIGASRSTILAVIADFPSYPEWAGQVKSAQVLSVGDDGLPATVRFVLDAGVISDDYVLAYTWADELVSWKIAEAGKMVSGLTGSYRLAEKGDSTEVTYELRRRPQGPHDRHDQAQGREGHHRHRPQGAEEARREGMRTLLFTGKGGVGKTTAAAATATLAARRGLKTLVVSTDTAHSLADALAVAPSGEPAEVTRGLYLQQVDTQKSMERHWGDLQDYARGLFTELGLDAITSEEVTVLPGAEEIIALLELREQARTGRWDVIVVDCAPTAETLRLLALPEALDWHVTRLLPIGRRVMRAVAPVIRAVAKVSAPEEGVLNAGSGCTRA